MHNTSQHLDEAGLISMKRVSDLALSPCGTWAAVCVQRLDKDQARYLSDLWRLELGSGTLHQLTRGEHQDRAPAFHPNGDLLFLSDRPLPTQGDDKPLTQVWSLPALGGEPAPLSQEPLGVLSFQCSQSLLVVEAPVLPGIPHEEQGEAWRQRNKRGPSARLYRQMPARHWDHWLPTEAPHLIAYPKDGPRVDLTPGFDRELRSSAWSLHPEGTRIALASVRMGPDHVPDSDLLLLDTQSGATEILESQPQTAFHDLRFSPCGRWLAAVRHARSLPVHGKPGLWLHDLEQGRGEALAPEWDRWPSLHGWTPDSARLLVTAPDLGYVPPFWVQREGGAITRVTHPEHGGSHSHLIATESGEVLGLRHRLTHPPEVFRAPAQALGQPRLLTQLGGYTQEQGQALVEVEDLQVISTDGEPCQYFLVRPRGQEGCPLVLWIHGGPMSQWADGWHWRWNSLLLASRGLAVALPNPRGSTGAGQRFIEGIWGNQWGGQCYRDLMCVTDALEQHPALDAARRAAMGGSFGGYMTNWIGAQSDRFCCLVTHAGIYSMESFLRVTDLPAWWVLQMGGVLPREDRDAYALYDPASHASGWSAPTLIIHGARDYRVPVGEALGLFDDLQRAGVDSRLLIYPDENHWILKPQNVAHWYGHVLSFLEEILKGDQTTQ